MKEETKELVDWIKKHIVPFKKSGIVPMEIITHGIEMQDKAMAFLDSLPEIESHLTCGGYIQDKNGTPCCVPDMINFVAKNDSTKRIGTLVWDSKNGNFLVIESNENCKNWRLDGISWFEKMTS